MKTKLRFLMALPILSSLACGKSDAEKFAEAFCAEVSKCCGEQGQPTDGRICKTFMSMAQDYNSAAGDACLAEIRAQAAEGKFCLSKSSDSSPCNSVYSDRAGNSKPGEACTGDSDCAKSSEGQVVCATVFVNGEGVSKCQVRIAGKPGEACIGTQEGDSFWGYGSDDLPSRATVCSISDGVRCDGNTCVALTEAGGSCLSSSDCVRSAYCDSSQDKCATRVANGATCAGPSYNNDCVAGNYCNATSKQCTPQLASGAPCSTSDMCLSESCSGTVCTEFGAGFAWAIFCGDM
jgi:hypothetical protein